MDKIKKISGKVKDAVKNKISNMGVKPIVEPGPDELFKKMFDNIVWVIVLVSVLYLLIMVFLSTQTFFNNNKIRSIQKQFPNRNKLKALEFHTAEGAEEEIDEIDIKEHTLADIQICASAKSYLVGRQLLDYGSQEMVVQTIKMGAKFIELDVFENRNKELVITNGVRAGNWKLTFNQIKLGDICHRIANFLFNPDVMNNFNDPMILFLNLNLPKNRMNEVAEIITQNFSSFLLDKKYSISGKANILDSPLEELLGKLIIMTSGAIGDTNLDKVVHLRIGDRLKKVYFDELNRLDKNEMIEFNKKHLTIVHPPLGFRSINYNPEVAFDYGCQIVCMFFQKADDFLEEYLTHFSNKSFRIKPFEFTRFNDIPQNGYDPHKIAYYDTYDDSDDSLLIRSKFAPTQSSDESNSGCCRTNMDDSMFDLDILDRSLVPADSDSSIDYQFNTIRLKLKKLNVAEHKDIEYIERLNMNDEIGLGNYIDRHIFLKETKDLIQNKFDLIYFILTKQLKKALSKQRSNLFTTDYEEKCINLDRIKCNEEPICYYNQGKRADVCDKKEDKILFPQYCLPKYEIANRNTCLADPDENSNSNNKAKNNKANLNKYKNKGVRGLFHKKLTSHSYFGKWSGKDGIFEIPDNQNSACEIKFTTPVDNKEFTIYIVDDNGDNIQLSNFENQNITGIRAKGTFVDRNLRNIENRLNLGRFPYHGFVDLKILNTSDQEVLKELEKQVDKCIYIPEEGKEKDANRDNVEVLLGLYKYLDIVKENENFKVDDKTYLINTNKTIYDASNLNDIGLYNYKMISPKCNLQLQGKFDRLPKAIMPKPPIKTVSIKNSLNNIDSDNVNSNVNSN